MNTHLSAQDIRKLAAGMQNNRLLTLSFPQDDAPCDILVVNRLEGEESLSRDFRFVIEMLSDNAKLDPNDFIGKLISVRLLRNDESFRHFNGYIFSFRLVRADGGITCYEADVGPWMRYLTLRKNNRLFLNQAIRGQTATIFQDYGTLPVWEWKVYEKDPSMSMACQFDEHDHNYVHRRWEHLGLCYWYEHTATEHKLIVSDPIRTEPAIDGDSPKIRYRSEAGSREADSVASWSPIEQITSTHILESRTDFKHSDLNARTGGLADARTDAWASSGGQQLEWYEYAGAYGHRNMDDGQWQTSRRIEAIEAIARQYEASGNNRFVMPGRWFQLTDQVGFQLSPSHYDDQYLITFAHHVATNNYLQGVGAKATYSNRFMCVSKRTRWRPIRGYNSVATRILAPQTATVVGPERESLYTDEYGRCLVQFHWDREGKYTTWVRVSSGWAGGGQGMSALPRIGSEVIVMWLDGNPDHPIVTGRVQNAVKLSAWRLPHQRALMGIRSPELVGEEGNQLGGRSNHLVLDDTANAIQAQLRSDHAASQLSLGSITRIEGWHGRQDARGEGFELRTDAVGAIRSGKGMLVSTEARQEAKSHISDVSEPISRLASAHALHDQMSTLAQRSGAQDDGGDQSNVADALHTQIEGIKGSTGSRGDDSFPELSEPHLLFAGASGLQATTSATVHVNGGDHVALTAGQNVSVAAGASLYASVVDKISLFAQRAAIRISAAMGDIILHAITSSIKLESAKSIQLLTKVVQITGVERLELHGGKSRLVLDDSGAQIFTPGKFVAFASTHSLPGPQDSPVGLAPKGVCVECMLKAARSGAALVPR
ncbi:type VI secretion system Vgr family protein [Trinickia dinghuensis]|uniref:Type VI secretion system tip protein VgrG n=1 Tax=Trinickia dinghuensis TaxID=2291023 RepID=A0A3D8K6E7_9BURK|nr:type VI secretion system Vgr family protein [Trinickia dinghuensis]RDV00988.1 type VI secretion system tip protein VgrG [Trinickia dinghuensis]